jgi:hypothetical protein
MLAACATTAPPAGPPRALYRDLERIVAFAETTGWDIDRREVDAVLGDALLTLCRVPEESRRALLVWVDQRIVALGGPVDEAWRRSSRKLGRVEVLLALTRLRMVLVAAMDAAPGDCPFWLEPSAGFRGRQISDDRWQLELGGGGKGILTGTQGVSDVTGGGAGRLNFYRHLGATWGIGIGIELGAGADFTVDENGQRSGLVFAFDVVTPVLFRWRAVNSFYELELGPFGHFTENQMELEPGVHVGFAVGGQALRQRWFLPGAAFAISYEHTFPDAGEPLDMLKLGFRVALNVDL